MGGGACWCLVKEKWAWWGKMGGFLSRGCAGGNSREGTRMRGKKKGRKEGKEEGGKRSGKNRKKRKI